MTDKESKVSSKKFSRSRKILKRILITAYCHDVISAKAVVLAFRLVDMREV